MFTLVSLLCAFKDRIDIFHESKRVKMNINALFCVGAENWIESKIQMNK